VSVGPRRRRASSLLVAASLVTLGACGGMVVVDGHHDPGAGGAPADAAPPIDAPADAVTEPPPSDAGTDASAPCDDGAVCSFRIDHDGDCLGAASVGDFCDFLATPCSSTPPDCAAISAIVGAPAQLASCGDGTSFCDFDWTGTLSSDALAKLCAAHMAAGQPINCILD
jgi:hypothetical protein